MLKQMILARHYSVLAFNTICPLPEAFQLL
jgi:hypothetical protein